jgi:hypothetical protein
VRTAMLNYGLCADEFVDTGGWPHQLYVREARRMLSDYVMLQQNCQGSRVAQDAIALGSYTMDSHNCQRVVQNGVVKNEGDVQAATPQPYGISYRSIVPRPAECENLFVPWALSASHVAFGSIRMEPVFMMTSQSAATAAAFAIDDEIPAQQVGYSKLALQLTADKLQTRWGSDSATGTIVDNSDTSGVAITGAWTVSTASAGFWGANYLHDQSTDKGTKSVRFTPNLAAAGEYDVYVRWTENPNRSTNVPIDVISTTGTDTFVVDQRANGGTWFFLRRAQCAAGTSAGVVVRTTGTAAGTYVIADAARWLPVGVPNVPVQIVASDARTREASADSARFTLVRPLVDSAAALTVSYGIGGSAENGIDFGALSGTTTFVAGANATTIPVQAIADSIAEGDETVVVSLQPGAGYIVGELNSATIRVVDKPIDAWRHAHFTNAELTDVAISGDGADPDTDGLTNLEEYPLALDPRRADAENVAVPQLAQDHLTLGFNRLKSASDVTVIAEGSYDLETWAVSDVVEELERIDQGTTERIVVRLIEPASSRPRGFLRLRITR